MIMSFRTRKQCFRMKLVYFRLSKYCPEMVLRILIHKHTQNTYIFFSCLQNYSTHINNNGHEFLGVFLNASKKFLSANAMPSRARKIFEEVGVWRVYTIGQLYPARRRVRMNFDVIKEDGKIVRSFFVERLN